MIPFSKEHMYVIHSTFACLSSRAPSGTYRTITEKSHDLSRYTEVKQDGCLPECNCTMLFQGFINTASNLGTCISGTRI